MPISTSDLHHLLRRTEFVVRPARVAALAGKTRTQAVDDIMRSTTAPSAPAAMYATPLGATSRQMVVMMHWWLNRMLRSPRPFQEKMTFFWFSHFTSAYADVLNARAFARQHMMYRTNALGNYRSLCQKMAIEPAMLKYLNNATNTYWSPNQNFARELMELYMLGVGHYTENDVVAGALAWSGHSIDTSTYAYRYYSDRHPPLNQTWSMFGIRRHWTGKQVIDHMLNDPELRTISSRFIVKKIWEHFAYANPSPAMISSLASGFVRSGYDIRALMRAVLTRPEFYSTQAKHGLVRSPLEYIVATMHATNTDAATLHPEWYDESMGMEILDPPNVSGWGSNGYWLNTSAFTGRAGLARRARVVMYSRGALAWVRDEPSVANAVTRMCRQFGFSPSSSTRRVMERYLVGVRGSPGEVWTQGAGLFAIAMLAPEFHQA